MAKFTIGGKEVEVPVLNFKSLKKIYPIITQMKSMSKNDLTNNPELAFEAVDSTLKIVEIAMSRGDNPMTFAQLEEALLPNEILGLQHSLTDLIKENGLGAEKGEPKAAVEDAAAESLSTETLTESSAKSSPDLEVPTGT